MQVTKCCVLLILSIVFHYYKKETSWRLSLFSGAPPLPAAKGRLPAGGLIEILQGELAGVSPTGTPSLRNRNILPKIDFDRLFHKRVVRTPEGQEVTIFLTVECIVLLAPLSVCG